MSTIDTNNNELKKLLNDRVNYCKNEIVRYTTGLKTLEEGVKEWENELEKLEETIKEETGLALFEARRRAGNAKELLASSHETKKKFELMLEATQAMLEDTYLQLNKIR